MKNLELDFAQRLKTADLLSKATGPLDKIALLSLVFHAIRFTDREMEQIKVTPMGNGVQSFEPPHPGFGTLHIQIEDAQAAMVLAEFNMCQSFTIADMNWFPAVKKQLEAESVPAKVKTIDVRAS